MAVYAIIVGGSLLGLVVAGNGKPKSNRPLVNDQHDNSDTPTDSFPAVNP